MLGLVNWRWSWIQKAEGQASGGLVEAFFFTAKPFRT